MSQPPTEKQVADYRAKYGAPVQPADIGEPEMTRGTVPVALVQSVIDVAHEEYAHVRHQLDDLLDRVAAAILDTIDEFGQGSPQHLRLRYALTGEGEGAPSAIAVAMASLRRTGAGVRPIERNAVYDWNGVRCIVNRVAKDLTWVDMTCTRGGSSWGKRQSLPLPDSFVRIN